MKTLGGLLVAAMLVFGSGCAKQDWIDRTLVTVDVTGVWTGGQTWGGERQRPAFGDVVLDLTQQGSTVKGSLRVEGQDHNENRGLLKAAWRAICSGSEARVAVWKES